MYYSSTQQTFNYIYKYTINNLVLIVLLFAVTLI